MEEDGIGTQQCINCGYATTSKFIGTKEDNEMYKTLPEEMQSWSKEEAGRIWIPSMMTLPFGTLYPTNVDGEMKWAFAEMTEIPEEEQENYPDENGGYYKQMYDTVNQKVYDVFIEAMAEMNERAKADGPTKITRTE
jgi:Zn ribbon nucleic-acid-binding protein